MSVRCRHHISRAATESALALAASNLADHRIYTFSARPSANGRMTGSISRSREQHPDRSAHCWHHLQSLENIVPVEHQANKRGYAFVVIRKGGLQPIIALRLAPLDQKQAAAAACVG